MSDAGRILVAAVLAVAWSFVVYQVGHENGSAEVQAPFDAYRLEAARLQRAADDKVRIAGQTLTRTLEEREKTHQEELDHAKTDSDRRIAELRSGALRVSIAARAPVCRQAGAAGDPALTVEPAETRAELAPEAAAALEGLGLDGDTAIIDLNACIDRYNGVRNASQLLNQGQ